MEWESKVWGQTRQVFEASDRSRHQLELLRGGFCSFHYHHHRSNLFIVESGKVRIVHTIGWQVFERVIGPGCADGATAVVAAEVAHQFQVLEAGEMIEEYYATPGHDCHNQDIYRFTTGGLLVADIATAIEDSGIIISENAFTGRDLRKAPYA